MIRLLLLLMVLLAQQGFAQALSARVDRQSLSLEDTLELTLESPAHTQFGKPDLSALTQDFEILSTRQINQLSNGTGTASTHSAWLISLKPKRSGSLTLAPLTIGELSSPALTVEVSEQTTAIPKQALYLEASLDQQEVYVQAQTILTVRVYHSVPLYDDSQLSPLEIKDVRVETLGQARTYEQTINEVLYGVIETRYALFAQKSGQLSVIPPTFSATPADLSQGINRPGTTLSISGQALPLVVKAKPASYPADALWLPAKALTLIEQLNPEPDAIQVGDSITREVQLIADGLPAVALPELSLNLPPQLKHYPDQPQLLDQKHPTGVRGERRESEVWVATRPGEVTLAPLTLNWWNTQTDQLETLTLAPRTLRVNDEQQTTVEPAPVQAPAIVHPTKLWPWQLATAVLLLTNIISLTLWWLARKQPAVRSVQTGPSPRTLLDDVRKACHSNDPSATRQALDAWARQQPETLAEMAARDQALSHALDELNGALYAKTAQLWDGQALWQAVRTLPPRALDENAQQENSSLPPLYPR